MKDFFQSPPVLTNTFKSDLLLQKYLAKRLPQAVADEITRGNLSVLEKNPQIKVVVKQNHPGWSTALALSTTENALTRYHNNIHAILANNDGMALGAIQAIKSGLKSKLDRQLFYQNEIQVMESQLRGDVKFTFKLGNSIKNSHAINKEGKEIFLLPIEVQNDLRTTIKSYLAEISKMEGEYASVKQEITIKKSGLDKAEETYED